MNSKRIVFLMLAMIVAAATAFLARAWLQAERAAVIAQAGAQKQAPVKPAAQVLVARNLVRAGQILKPEDMRWLPWPQGALPATYIIEGKRPISEFVGSVARSTFHVGEPIVESELIVPGSRGFLAAVLRPGMRAVSVPATPTTTVSGFIYAGDRVDVLLTHVLNAQSGQHSATETILRNARVIAMDQKLDFVPGDKPEHAKTATLELTAKQTEIVTLGVKMGDLSLVLRSLQDPDDAERDPAAAEEASADIGHSYTHDTQVSPLIKRDTPPAEKIVAIKDSVFVLRGARTSKQELDGTVPVDPAPSPATPDAKKTGTPFTRTYESVPQ